MTFSIDNPEVGGGWNNNPFGKYVWEKSSGEQGLNLPQRVRRSKWVCAKYESQVSVIMFGKNINPAILLCQFHRLFYS